MVTGRTAVVLAGISRRTLNHLEVLQHPAMRQTQGRSSLIKALVAQAMRALQQDSFIFWTGGRKHCQKKVVEQILFIAGPRVSRAGNVCAFQRGNKRNILQEGMTCYEQHGSRQKKG